LPDGREVLNMKRLLLSTFALLALCDSALAWGDLGHRVICEMAFRLVQPDTLRRLIESDTEFKIFADSCVFPDHPRRRASEHFLNLPRDAKGLTSDECPQADKCELTAILSISRYTSLSEMTVAATTSA
jgi:hypothetical protein